MADYKHWIALANSKGIGLSSLREIYETLKAKNLSLSDLFGISPDEIRHEFCFNEPIIAGFTEATGNIERVEEEYFSMIDSGISVTLFFENQYPEKLSSSLKSLAPPILYHIGDLNILKNDSAAVLSHAKIEPETELVTYNSCKELALHGITVISGMVSKVGTVIHGATLENGGNTVGIIPCGIMKFKMPKYLENLKSTDKFLLLSEFPANQETTVFNAIRRNRTICALSDAVLILSSIKDEGIFEAGKSASKLQRPLYTIEHISYPKSSTGNAELITEYGAKGIKLNKTDDNILPDMNNLIGAIKSRK